MDEYTVAAGIPEGFPAPNLQRALALDVPGQILAAWRDLATADGLDAKGEYLASIASQQAFRYPYLEDPNRVAVVNVARHASLVEQGRAGFHLPSRWTKWKIGKRGNRFAHVLLPHKSPKSAGGGATRGRTRGAMPAEVYQRAVKLQHGQRLTGFGDLYKQSKVYGLMAKQGMNVPAHLQEVGHYTWKSSQFEGMFTTTIQRTERRDRSAKYATVRTITPESAGWYIPPTQGRHYARRAFETARDAIEQTINEAVAADIEAAIEAIAGDFA